MSENKILNFDDNIELLLNMAEDYSQKGQHVKAVSLIRRVLKKAPEDIVAKFALAEELSVVGQYRLAADILFELLTKDPENPEVNLALGEIFYSLNNWNLSAYYFKIYSRLSVDELNTEHFEDILSLEIPKKFSIIHPMTAERALELRQRAAMYMREGRIEDARNIFKEIEDSFPQDSMIKTDIAFTYLLKNDIKNGKLYAQQAYELDSSNISALCNLAMAYSLDNENELCDEICQKLNDSATNEPIEIFKIASTFCEIKKDDFAFVWLKKFLQTDPQQSMEIYYLCAFAGFNSGNYEACEKILNYILLLDANNHIAKYYLKELKPYLVYKEILNSKRWDYYPQIPLSVWRRRIEILNTKQDFYGIWEDDELMEYLDWAFDTLEDSIFHEKLIEKLSKTDKKNCIVYFKKLLLNQNLDLAIKGRVLYYLLFLGVRGRFFMVRDGYFSFIDVPKNIPHIVSDAVYLCIATLSDVFMMDSKYPSVVIKVAKNIQKRMLDNGSLLDINIKQLSAVIARNCNFDWLDDKKIMELFAVSYKEIVDLNDYIFNNI